VAPSITSTSSAQRQHAAASKPQRTKRTSPTRAQLRQLATGIVILRVPQVLAKTGMSRSKLYALLDPKSRYFDETFPKRAVIGTGPHARTVGWRQHEIDLWLDAQFDDKQGGQS
jgi:prophage regulatory protein